MHINVLFDESGTHEGASSLTMGIAVARLLQWQRFDKAWRKMLSKRGVRYFHGRRLRARRGDFDGWKNAQVEDLLDRMEDIIEKRILFRLTMRLDYADYEEHFAAGGWPRKPIKDSPYGLCFRLAMVWIAVQAPIYYAGSELDVRFILEGGHKNFGDAKRIFDEEKAFMSTPTLRLKELLPGAKEEYPGLQAADALAYLTYKSIERGEDTFTMPEAASLEAVEKAYGGRSPIAHFHITPPILRNARELLIKRVQGGMLGPSLEPI